MVLIAGVAAAAAAALAGWNYLNQSGQAANTIVGIRQQAGVLAALVNMVNALLDALLLVRRVSAGGSSSALGTFGRRVAEAE